MKGDSKKSEWIAETYDLFHLDVYRFLMSFTGSKSDAEDLTQETFMQLLKSSESIMNKKNPKTWILKVAKYKAIDHHRKRKFTVFSKEKFIKEVPAEGLNLDDNIIENEALKELMDCISSLKPTFKLVVILRGINELSTAETAAVLQCSESKVKTTYHRALKQLKSKLTNHSKGGNFLENVR
ncbi:RNA polymerase sigma factor [Guptibacillus hwajinpoensis]|uniref:RNA polymerase sigma factor n=1 Tax=Guptibacillus hwajinpoensis TaxID=208199 RepID=UPI00384BF79F